MKLQLRLAFLIFLFLIGSINNSKGGHIIGGEMTYVCDGPGSIPDTKVYTFTLTLYRGCVGALFDNPDGQTVGSVSIYQGDSNIEYQNITLGFPNIESINYNTSDPCLVVPPNVCGQSGAYTFSVELPVITESFHIVYQRCCRDVSIVNLVNPGDSGATFGIELLPAAQNLCNSSPVFNDFPTSIICVNENVNIDNTAIDSDGDLLVYSFCSPLLGGSMLDVAPNPDAPPPYNNIGFLAPYTETSPLGGSPEVIIDPASGALMGLVNTQGKFAVGICVEEYRNGELLSKVRRDYQFNISTCNPVNDALANTPSNIVDGVYIYESCLDSTITFVNNSVTQNVFEYEWFFDLGNNQSLSFDTEDVTVTFPGPGIYPGFMSINPGSNCSDTLFIEVNIQSEIGLDFDYSYDSCLTNPIVFTPSTVIDQTNIDQWEWDFGDGNFSMESNPEHQYNNLGDWTVSLTATSDEGCSQTITDQITWFPIPEILITSDVQAGCIFTPITFTNLTSPIDNSYNIFWDFGDGNTSTESDPIHTYEAAGVYDVNVSITSPLGCTLEKEYSEFITQSTVGLDFGYSYDSCSNNPIVFTPSTVIDEANVDQWEWEFGDGNSSMESNPEHQYDNLGNWMVSLTATSDEGCSETISDQVAWFPIPEILITSDVQAGCIFTPIIFTNLTSPVNSSYDIFWDFGDGNTSTELEPIHTYEEAGVYDVNISITSPLDCTIEKEYSELISIESYPTADFSFTPDQSNSLASEVTFTDLSYEAISWEWTFDNFGNSNLQNPTFVFPDTGIMKIQLVATTANGCQDSMIQYLDIEPLIFYYVPNAFSPNDDGINDIFKIEGDDLIGVKDFQMIITNRWGGVVFESDSPLEGWDGKNIKRKTKRSNMGVYVVYVRFKSPRGKFFEYRGDLTLM